MTLDRVRVLLANGQFLRFLVAGSVNTLFSFGVNIAAMLAGLPVWLAILIGTVAGIAFNFLTHGGYTFRDMSASRLPRYVSGYAALYLIALLAFDALHRFVPNPIACQALMLIPMALLSYLVMSRFVFQKRRER